MTEPQMDYHQDNAKVVTKIVQRWRKTSFSRIWISGGMTCALNDLCHHLGIVLVIVHLRLGHRTKKFWSVRLGNCRSTSDLRRRIMTGAQSLADLLQAEYSR